MIVAPPSAINATLYVKLDFNFIRGTPFTTAGFARMCGLSGPRPRAEGASPDAAPRLRLCACKKEHDTRAIQGWLGR
jgi:hypothetical protein